MPRCLHPKNLVVAVVIFISLSCLILWRTDDTSNTRAHLDAKYEQLLRDYQSKRTKKTNKVMIYTPTNQTSDVVLHIKEKPSAIPQQLQILSSNFSIPTDDLSPTTINDLFIAVKSSGKFHKTRLPLLLDTWIPLARQSTYLITDTEDADLAARLEPGHYQQSKCSTSHYRQGLVCKVSMAYDLFMTQQRRWFCIADDDTYINIPNLVALLQEYDYTKDWYIGRPSLKYPIRVTIDNSKQSFWFHTGGAGYCISRGLALRMSPYALGGRLRELADRIRVPDDVAVGYIINKRLGVDITRVVKFHSHLEGLWRISPNDLKTQVTLSYGEFETGPNHVITNVVNTGGIIPTYPPPFDPTRLRSVHCYLFPNARECPKFGVAS